MRKTTSKELPECDLPFLVCIDPGKVNFAYVIIDTRRGQVQEYDLLQTTFTDLTDGDAIRREKDALQSVFTGIRKRYKSFGLVYERFMPRHLQKGCVAEIVNMVIGGFIFTLLEEDSKVTPIALSAATWKNYMDARSLRFNNETIPIHILDAISMGHYYLLKSGTVGFPRIRYTIQTINSTDYGWVFKRQIWEKTSRAS